tara:strand:- start:4739 stop:5008 length:270 start_codon:yes stop_codon:yes gene_type:complete
MTFYVYLICSKNNNNRLISYVGYTNNLNKRIYLHNNSKGAKFTKGKKWILLYKKKFLFKNEAMKYEYSLKKDRVKREYLKKKYYLYEKT